MKCIVLFVISIFLIGSVSAQKPSINSGDYSRWPFLSGAELSNDGQYVLYKILKGDGLKVQSGNKIVVKHINSDREIPLPYNSEQHSFAGDSKFLIFKLPGDSLGIVHLGVGSIQYIPHVV